MDNRVVLVPVRGNEVGKALGGVSRSTVYRLIEADELTAVHIGARIFVTARSITAYLDRITASA